MNVPFGDLKTHYNKYQNQIDAAIQQTLSSGQFILGKELENFERAFAEYLGVKYVIGCASGTEAIYLALACLNIGPGDEVITVAHTAVPTISAISMTGATPVFVDIDPITLTLDPKLIETKITSNTRAILPVHLYGQMAAMDDIISIAHEHNLAVIEDCAQSSGAAYRGIKSGAIGMLGTFSFYPSKNLAAFGDGGAISTNDQGLRERLLMLRNYGQSQRYYHEIIGINSRLDEIQAAILACQLPYLDKWNERRRHIAHTYTQALKDLLVTPTGVAFAPHIYHLYVVQTEYRSQLQEYLTRCSVQSLIHYPIPAHLQKAYKYLGYKKGDLPISELCAEQVLSLPIFPELDDDQIKTVISAVRNFFDQSPEQRAQRVDVTDVPMVFPPVVQVTA